MTRNGREPWYNVEVNEFEVELSNTTKQPKEAVNAILLLCYKLQLNKADHLWAILISYRCVMFYSMIWLDS